MLNRFNLHKFIAYSVFLLVMVAISEYIMGGMNSVRKLGRPRPEFFCSVELSTGVNTRGTRDYIHSSTCHSQKLHSRKMEDRLIKPIRLCRRIENIRRDDIRICNCTM